MHETKQIGLLEYMTTENRSFSHGYSFACCVLMGGPIAPSRFNAAQEKVCNEERLVTQQLSFWYFDFLVPFTVVADYEHNDVLAFDTIRYCSLQSPF